MPAIVPRRTAAPDAEVIIRYITAHDREKRCPSHVVLIELGADHAQPASQYRVVLPYGQLPSDTLVTDRGSRLHFLTGTSWHQLDM